MFSVLHRFRGYFASWLRLCRPVLRLLPDVRGTVRVSRMQRTVLRAGNVLDVRVCGGHSVLRNHSVQFMRRAVHRMH